MKKLENCKGASAETAAEMERGLGGTLRRLASAAEGVALAFGEIVSQTFGPTIEFASVLCVKIAELLKDSILVSEALAVLGTSMGLAVLFKSIFMLNSGVKMIISPLLTLDRILYGHQHASRSEAKQTCGSRKDESLSQRNGAGES